MSCSEKTAENRSFGLSCASTGNGAAAAIKPVPIRKSRRVARMFIVSSRGSASFADVRLVACQNVLNGSFKSTARPNRPGRRRPSRSALREILCHRGFVGLGAGKQLERADRLVDCHAEARKRAAAALAGEPQQRRLR